MAVGLSGWRRRIGAVSIAFGLLVAAGCGSEGTRTAVGADVDRPEQVLSIREVRFENVAQEVGLDFRHGAFQWGTSPDVGAMMGGGLCWIDYDGDGWLDLYAVNTWSDDEWGRWREQGALPSSQLFHNEVGQFTDVTEATAAGVETRGMGCVAADLDLDGWTDLYITTERANVLLWNDGGNGFVDDAALAEPSGAAAYGWHGGASVGDVDGNGWPDVFVAGYTDLNRPIPSATKGFPNTFEPEPDLLFLNEGPSGGARVRFREAAVEVGIEPAGPDYALGSVLSDLDGDGDLDLYVANDTTSNQLYENVPTTDGAGFRLVERGVAAGVGDTGAGMGVAAVDIDGDQLPDLTVTNQLKEGDRVVRNAGSAELTFTDELDSMGIPELGVGSTGWGVTWADIDLDADLDLFIAHGAIPVQDLVADRQVPQLVENALQQAPISSPDVTIDVGLDDVGAHLGRGVAAADFDNDGDVDIAMGTIGGDLVLLRNSGAGGTWLEVTTGTPAPGAVVTVELPSGFRTLRRELIAGSSYLSSEDPRAHFGLSAFDRATVTVEWPDGAVVTLRDVEAGQILRVQHPGRG